MSSMSRSKPILMCRTVGHSWDEYDPGGNVRPLGGTLFALRCVRCTTERHDTVDIYGEVIGRRYIYAAGYRRTKGEGRPDRRELRQQLLARRLDIVRRRQMRSAS